MNSNFKTDLKNSYSIDDPTVEKVASIMDRVFRPEPYSTPKDKLTAAAKLAGMFDNMTPEQALGIVNTVLASEEDPSEDTAQEKEEETENNTSEDNSDEKDDNLEGLFDD